MAELSLEVTNATIAAHYSGLVDGLLIDGSDAAEAESLGLPVHVTSTLMQGDDDRRRLAQEALAFAASLSADRRTR